MQPILTIKSILIPCPKQVASLTAQLEASTSESDRLRSDLTIMTKAREAAEQEVALVRGQAVDLQDLLDRLREEKEDLQAECQGLKSEGGGGFDEIQRLNQSLNQEIAGLRAAIVEQQGRGGGQMFGFCPSSSLPTLQYCRKKPHLPKIGTLSQKNPAHVNQFLAWLATYHLFLRF